MRESVPEAHRPLWVDEPYQVAVKNRTNGR